MYNFVGYGLDKETELINMDDVAKLAEKQTKLLIADTHLSQS